MKSAAAVQTQKPSTSASQRAKSYLKDNWQLYIMILPAVAYFIIFHYMPMYGIQIAFKDYKVSQGIMGSPWIGFENFTTFFNSYLFGCLISNTLLFKLFDLLL